MTLSRKDHFILAASQLVKPPEFYKGVEETKRSFNRYREEVERVALELMKLGEKPCHNVGVSNKTMMDIIILFL